MVNNNLNHNPATSSRNAKSLQNPKHWNFFQNPLSPKPYSPRLRKIGMSLFASHLTLSGLMDPFKYSARGIKHKFLLNSGQLLHFPVKGAQVNGVHYSLASGSVCLHNWSLNREIKLDFCIARVIKVDIFCVISVLEFKKRFTSEQKKIYWQNSDIGLSLCPKTHTYLMFILLRVIFINIFQLSKFLLEDLINNIGLSDTIKSI